MSYDSGAFATRRRSPQASWGRLKTRPRFEGRASAHETGATESCRAVAEGNCPTAS